MHLSQPAFSTRIRRLERALEAALVDRSVKWLTLTREGGTFEPPARAPLAQLAAAVDDVDADGSCA